MIPEDIRERAKIKAHKKVCLSVTTLVSHSIADVYTRCPYLVERADDFCVCTYKCKIVNDAQ